MKHILRNGLLAAGILAAAGAGFARSAAAGELVLTPGERIVVYHDLYPRAYAFGPYPYRHVAPTYTAIGTVLPPRAILRPVPPAIVPPELFHYGYTVVEERVVIADPYSREIVDVIYEPGS